jgi:hypothetical protein
MQALGWAQRRGHGELLEMCEHGCGGCERSSVGVVGLAHEELQLAQAAEPRRAENGVAEPTASAKRAERVDGATIDGELLSEKLALERARLPHWLRCSPRPVLDSSATAQCFFGTRLEDRSWWCVVVTRRSLSVQTR